MKNSFEYAIHGTRLLTLGFALIACLFSVHGQSSENDYESQARSLTKELADRHFDAIIPRFSPQVAKVLDASKLEASWDGVIVKYGTFSSVERVEQEVKSGLHVVYVACIFSQGKLTLIYGFDSNNQVAAFTSVPTEAREAWKAPDYVKPDSFTERAVTVTTGAFQLPGTLTVPNGSGPFPAVVLVHGSGPNDQDEALGPTKMFKDLAWGLASKGIAVLRYEKRTHKYRGKSSADMNAFTIMDETVDDARSAVALLTNTSGIDSKRIFVAGHSLGAFVGPRIVTGDSQIRGVILLAGNTRPLEDLVVEQVRYQASLSGAKPTPEAQQMIESAEKTYRDFKSPDLKPGMTVYLLGAALPASYVLDLRNYNPAQTAAALKIPIFILQGDRDYQVRIADFDGWKKALAGHKNVSFRLYPALNHLFMPGTGPSSDEEYLKPNHVLADVVNDMSDWINRNGISK